MKYIHYIGYLFWIAVIYFLVSFYISCLIPKEKEAIEYKRQQTISGSIGGNQLIPEKEEIPEHPNLPTRIDTIYRDRTKTEIKYIVQKVDTAAIIADYIMKRSYNITAVESKEFGTIKLFPTVQYNQLSSLDYKFTPIQKQKNIHKERIWLPFLSGSYSTLGIIGIGGGIFYHNLGFEYQYQRDIAGDNNGHSFGIKYKF